MKTGLRLSIPSLSAFYKENLFAEKDPKFSIRCFWTPCSYHSVWYKTILRNKHR